MLSKLWIEMAMERMYSLLLVEMLNPCIVLKRTDSRIYTLQISRSATSNRSVKAECGEKRSDPFRRGSPGFTGPTMSPDSSWTGPSTKDPSIRRTNSNRFGWRGRCWPLHNRCPAFSGLYRQREVWTSNLFFLPLDHRVSTLRGETRLQLRFRNWRLLVYR